MKSEIVDLNSNASDFFGFKDTVSHTIRKCLVNKTEFTFIKEANSQTWVPNGFLKSRKKRMQ